MRGGPGGLQRPVLDAANATTVEHTEDYIPNDQRGAFQIGRVNCRHAGTRPGPSWITVEGLEITGSRPGNYFFNSYGKRMPYGRNAAGVYLICGDRVSIVDCEIHGNGNGIFAFGEPYKFVRPPGAPAETTNLVLQANYIHSNGVAGSDQMQ